MSIDRNNFEPNYLYQTKSIPFSVYFDDPRLRIFLIENIQHNWRWLSRHDSGIRDSDVFIVRCGWHHNESLAAEARQVVDLLDVRRSQFVFLGNSDEEVERLRHVGFAAHRVNHNCFIDHEFVRRAPQPKRFDAVYVGRLVDFKRHALASEVERLALVAGNSWSADTIDEIPSHIFLNDEPLAPRGVFDVVSAARCGLILSEAEGACFASSEYLLCGIPVVSTRSRGGRDLWYDDYNSIICDDRPEAVAEAVRFFVDNPRNPAVIRSRHIEQSLAERRTFVEVVDGIFDRHGVRNVVAEHFVQQRMVHKLFESETPDFETHFGSPRVTAAR